jgi:hypothetical protein
MVPGRDDETKPGFTVSDRRSFADAVTGSAQRAADPVAPSGEPSQEPGAAAWEPSSPIDFHTFILSLGSSALLHLGELDGPDGTAGKPELALAKHTIDVIAMLQAKTKGNLTPPEANLVESLLYDLRLRYFEKSKTPG